MKLHLYRMSLSERDLDLVDMAQKPQTGEAEVSSRFDFLSGKLKESFSYETKTGLQMRYVPLWSDKGIIKAILAKLSIRAGRHDLTDPLALVQSPDWEVCNIYINLNDDEQVIGIDKNARIQAKTGNIIRNFADAINKNSLYYKIDTFPIHNENDFWNSISAHDGKITSITFELVIPNPPDTTSPTREGLKKIREAIKARKRTEKFESEDGLDLDNDMIRDREEYASSGNGETIAKDGRKTIFNSKHKVKSVLLSDEIIQDISKIKEVSPSLSSELRAILKKK